MKSLFYEWWPPLPCPPREGLQRHKYDHHTRCRDKKMSRLYVQLGCPPVRYARLCDAYPEWTKKNARDTPSKKLLNYVHTQSIAPLTESENYLLDSRTVYGKNRSDSPRSTHYQARDELSQCEQLWSLRDYFRVCLILLCRSEFGNFCYHYSPDVGEPN